MPVLVGHNIDAIREEIMRLESAEFDADAWARVLADLRAADRPAALADATRRMETAKGNQAYHVGVDWAGGKDRSATWNSVAVETDYNADGKLKAFRVWCEDDWSMFIHAGTVGKAKTIFAQSYPGSDTPDFTDIRARRCRGSDLLDITPFTDDTLRKAGYHIPMPDDPDYDDHDPDGFLEFCPCSMCKYELTKPEYRVGIMAKVEA